MKRVTAMAMSTLLSGAVQQTMANNVEAVMYLDTEMPCLSGERLSGKIVIRNNRGTDIKLVDEDILSYFQLYWRPNISVQEARTIYAEAERGFGERISRSTVKGTTDAMVEKNERIVILRNGESKEIVFENREIDESNLLRHAGYSKKRIPFAVELYLSPDTWVPVDVRPPISVAYDAKAGTPVKEGKWIKSDDPWVWRARIDEKEFVFVKTNSVSPTYRLSEVHPDDTVVHTNKAITITRKDGSVRTIPEADIPRVSAERKAAIRKNWPKEGNTP